MLDLKARLDKSEKGEISDWVVYGLCFRSLYRGHGFLHLILVALFVMCTSTLGFGHYLSLALLTLSMYLPLVAANLSYRCLKKLKSN